ncbi:creatininase family protein [Aurantimonas sp. VKM B-3413]|uniref:creatininase family protein n=1 Tax=Aurantimonas sp. VKM B-3413 TaxID=2779401 RepID=UPI001E40CECF|nr:creatininase family protein [Aurantimonas sp. VKM B-3413]MCB8837070.1 creatininase family protein [Aurantimonas sp. VKM B-3413]
MRRRFEEMTSRELEEVPDLAAAVAVLPIAAVEQHGAHLPLGTDAILADAMVDAVVARLPEDRPVTFLSTLRIGKSIEHTHFPGTLDLGWQTATAQLIAVGASLHAGGFRRLVIVNAHGGNTPVMDTAALELRQNLGMLVGTCSWLRFGYPDGVLPPEEIATGIHGGAVETALMLHFRPDLVRQDRLARFASLQSELAERALRLRAHGRLGFGWMADDLNPAGVVGDATLATPETGRAIADHQAAAFIEYLDDLLAFDLSRLQVRGATGGACERS